uniref:Cystatin-B n=1 Tax=Sarcoptes scabiei TaxID=52283 RepID=A0A834RF14_SARSC
MEIQEEFVCGGLSSLNTELLEPIRYRSQIVAGTNYFVKCHLGQNECIHLLVYEPLPCYGGEPRLIGISPNKHSIEDPIEAHQFR